MNDETEHDDGSTTDPMPGPDFQDAGDVCKWYGQQVIRNITLARREKSLTRLRALSSAMDTWTKLHRLAAETSELADLRAELDELRAEIEAERKGGPKGVVRQ